VEWARLICLKTPLNQNKKAAEGDSQVAGAYIEIKRTPTCTKKRDKKG
jgi:hypothetical protein